MPGHCGGFGQGARELPSVCSLLFVESQRSPAQTLQLQVLPGHAHHFTLRVMVGPRRGRIHPPLAPARWWPYDKRLVPAPCRDLLSDTSLGAAVIGKPDQEPERVQDQAEGAGGLTARPAVGCWGRFPARHSPGGEPGDNEAHSQGN